MAESSKKSLELSLNKMMKQYILGKLYEHPDFSKTFDSYATLSEIFSTKKPEIAGIIKPPAKTKLTDEQRKNNSEVRKQYKLLHPTRNPPVTISTAHIVGQYVATIVKKIQTELALTTMPENSLYNWILKSTKVQTGISCTELSDYLCAYFATNLGISLAQASEPAKVMSGFIKKLSRDLAELVMYKRKNELLRRAVPKRITNESDSESEDDDESNDTTTKRTPSLYASVKFDLSDIQFAIRKLCDNEQNSFDCQMINMINQLYLDNRTVYINEYNKKILAKETKQPVESKVIKPADTVTTGFTIKVSGGTEWD
jgi:hypothetical protein